jgi:hypothetical protein
MLPPEPSGPGWVSNLGKAVHKTTVAVRKSGGTKSKSVGRSSSGGGSSRSSGGGGGGGSNFSRNVGRSSGGGGGGGGGAVVSHTAAPVIPSINAYLGTDSAYQQAVSGGKRTLADYIADITRRKGEATTQYNNTVDSMGRDRTTQLDQLRQEYASRGLINSGLFGQKEGEFQQQYNDQLNALGQQQSGLLADLLSQQNNYKREYDLAVQQAKQEALARRAAKYQIG